MPRLSDAERNQEIGMLHNSSINHVAAFLTRQERQYMYDIYTEECSRQVLLKTGLGLEDRRDDRRRRQKDAFTSPQTEVSLSK